MNKFKDWLNEMANKFPEGFSFKELTRIPKFTARVKYVDKFLKHIGSGSSRVTYGIPSTNPKVEYERVLKIAQNQAGLAQNMAEIEAEKDKLLCCAPVYHATKRAKFVEMQYAYPVKNLKEISDWIGHNIYDICEPGEEWKRETLSSSLADKGLQLKADWVSDFDTLIVKYQTLAGDLLTDRHWGWINRRGKGKMPVVFDFGYTEDIASKFYNSSNLGVDETTPIPKSVIAQGIQKDERSFPNYNYSIVQYLYNSQPYNPDNKTPARTYFCDPNMYLFSKISIWKNGLKYFRIGKRPVIEKTISKAGGTWYPAGSVVGIQLEKGQIGNGSIQVKRSGNNLTPIRNLSVYVPISTGIKASYIKNYSYRDNMNLHYYSPRVEAGQGYYMDTILTQKFFKSEYIQNPENNVLIRKVSPDAKILDLQKPTPYEIIKHFSDELWSQGEAEKNYDNSYNYSFFLSRDSVYGTGDSPETAFVDFLKKARAGTVLKVIVSLQLGYDTIPNMLSSEGYQASYDRNNNVLVVYNYDDIDKVLQ